MYSCVEQVTYSADKGAFFFSEKGLLQMSVYSKCWREVTGVNLLFSQTVGRTSSAEAAFLSSDKRTPHET